ncbi:hypothetical protein TorRG33x02_259600 [Trema orientale]|uniref:Uncharacterized protein n=1 Tax=Trema orientale TaxID=63057 RepID=A0A2P5D7S2_TREOI|nr:hypothetical protein TorRG33x02_259600 [Trema orientale]
MQATSYASSSLIGTETVEPLSVAIREEVLALCWFKLRLGHLFLPTSSGILPRWSWKEISYAHLASFMCISLITNSRALDLMNSRALDLTNSMNETSHDLIVY